MVVVGSFAFLGFDDVFGDSVGLDVVGAGADAASVGLAPPVEGAAAGIGAGAAGAGVADVAAGVAALAVVFLGCGAALCCLACLALCVVLAFVAAVVGVLVAAAGWALVVDFVDPPLPQPAATAATAATVQARPRFMLAGLPFVLSNTSVPQYKRVSDYKGSQPLQGPSGRSWLLYTHRRPPRLRAFRARPQGDESMADANRAMR